MNRMRGFIHVSTAYVNSNLPRGSHIEERIYPLHDAQGARIQHAALAARLAALPPAKAEHTVSRCPSLFHSLRSQHPACVLTPRLQHPKSCRLFASRLTVDCTVCGECMRMALCAYLECMPFLPSRHRACCARQACPTATR